MSLQVPERVGVAALFSPAWDLYHEPMRIVCPACAAAYEVPEDRLAPGRIVRCARCGADWAPLMAEAEPIVPEPSPEVGPSPEPLPPPEPLPEPPLEPPSVPVATTPMVERSEPEKRPRQAPVAVGWVLSLLVLAALGWGAYATRTEVMRAWPPSERAYKAIGLSDAH